jgi:hypothetical protein
MKKFIFIAVMVMMILPMTGQASVIDNVRGHILLQVEENGEAWYVNPDDDNRYYMKDGSVAYQMMRNFGLGITDVDLSKIPSVNDTTEMKNASSICGSNSLANRLKGDILLQVKQNGEAWYIYPKTCRRIYMKDGDAAYGIMRYLGLGITNQNLNSIELGNNVNIPEDSNTNTTTNTTNTDSSNNTSSALADNDNDGIPNEYDIYPNGGGYVYNSNYTITILDRSYPISISIPEDRYYMYKQYMSHKFSYGFTNITDYVTPNDPVIEQIVTRINQISPDIDPLYYYRLINEIVYESDFNSTGLDEYPKYSVETLIDRNGDCEDTSFLIASLLKKLVKDVVLLRYPSHLAVGVNMSDAEISSFNSFIDAMNPLYAELVKYDPSTYPPAVKWGYDGWDLYHHLEYYSYNGKKYVYLESTINSNYLSLGQIPTDLKNSEVHIHPVY